MKDFAPRLNQILKYTSLYSSHPGQPEPGSIKLLSLINEGGVSNVYKGQKLYGSRSKQESDFLAVKILKQRYTSSAPHISTFENEFQISRDIAHPGIVPVYDLLCSGPFLALTMKLIDAPSMEHFIDRNNFNIREKMECIISLADILNYLHGQGVIHGDIKPSNILILPNFRVNLLDFGVSESLSYSGPRPAYSYSRLYSSPERMMGFRSEFRDDIYSFGRVAYAFLWGLQLLDAEVTVGNNASQYPECSKLKSLILECVSQNQHRRPRDGRVLYERLKEIIL